MKIIPKINPIAIMMHLNTSKNTLIFVLGLLIILSILFIYIRFYSSAAREPFSGESGYASTPFFYIPDLSGLDVAILTFNPLEQDTRTGESTDASALSLDISKIKRKEKTTLNDIVKETVDMITFFESTAGIEIAGDYKKKYELDVVGTDLYKKIQKIKETNVAALDHEFSKYFSQVEEKTMREFNNKIKPYNYFMNVVSLHVSLDGKKTIGGKNAMRRYFLKKMAEYRGNIGQLADLKSEFYSIIAPGYLMRTIFREYLNNIQFYKDQTDISLLLNTVKDQLLKTREDDDNDTREGASDTIKLLEHPIVAKLYKYVEICNSFWDFLSKCEETKGNMKGLFMKYGDYVYGQPSFLIKMFNV